MCNIQPSIIRVPLIPPGRLFFLIGKYFCPTVRIDVNRYCEREGYVELFGTDKFDYPTVFAVRTGILNAGIFENVRILSNSLGKTIPVVFNKQTLHRFPYVFPSNKQFKFSSPGIINNVKYGIHIKREGSAALLYYRPIYPFDIENHLLYDNIFGKIKVASRNISYRLFKWILYSKFGLLLSKKELQIDVQLSRPLSGKFVDGEFESDNWQISSHDLARSILQTAEKAGYVKISSQLNEVNSSLDALHLSISEIHGINFSKIDNLISGKVYLGSAGRLLYIKDAFHNSTELLFGDAFEILVL